MKVFGKALEMGAKVATKVKANGPTELLVVGTALTVGTIIFAHRAGRKVEETVMVNKEQINNLKEIKEAGSYIDEAGEEVEFTESEYKKELTKSYISFAWDMTKLYGPVVLCEGAAVVSFISGHRILAKRLAGATALYLATEEAFNQYRENVVKVWDKETDEKLYYGLTDTIVEEYKETKIDEKTGEEVEVGKTKKREVAVLPTDGPVPGASMYAVWADECCAFDITKNYHYAMTWLNNAESLANGMLSNCKSGMLTMNDIYETLGCLSSLDERKMLMAHETGWVRNSKIGDGYVKFIIKSIKTTVLNAAGDYVPCTRVLIDFNCPGSIRSQLAA
jgi:hypothetical protein